MTTKSILAFDLDGTLTQRNTTEIKPDGLVAILNDLAAIGHESVLVTGKPTAYAQRIVAENRLNQQAVIAENASVYAPNLASAPIIYGPGVEQIRKVKVLLGLDAQSKGISEILIQGVKHETVIDPDDVSILTIFSNANSVAHRWQFTQTISTEEIYEYLRAIISKNNLSDAVFVLPPFPDGGIQVVRKENSGKIIDKSFLPVVVKLLFDVSPSVPIAMFGDGHNDIPAMGAKGVLPLTFQNAEQQVKEFVRKDHGYVSNYDAPDGLGVPDGIRWLNEAIGFFGEDKMLVNAILQKYIQLI